MRLAVFGTGYVGLVSAVCLAKLGHSVVGVDKNPDIVAKLADGIPTIYEPDLEEMLGAGLDSGRLRFTTDAEEAIDHSDIVLLCVGTPGQSDGHVDLSQVEEAAQSIAPLLNGYKLIVEKSTVPVRTAQRIDSIVRRLVKPGHDFDVASNPEFLREGSAIQDFLRPDRIIVGADTDRARSLLLELYEASFDCPILVTDVKTAELIKHASNAFLATKISFINMVSDLCDRVGVDVAMVARGIGLDPRIGGRFLEAGLGYGGSCFPKDVRAFVNIAEDVGVEFTLLRAVERINNRRVPQLLKKVERAVGGVRGKTLAILGVAFKSNTDDIREAPSLRVVPALKAAGGMLRVYDPHAAGNMARVYPPDHQLCYVASPYEAGQGAHALIITTNWDEFRSLDWQRIRTLMHTPIIVDGRNLFSPDEMRERGFDYYTLGRGDVGKGLCSSERISRGE